MAVGSDWATPCVAICPLAPGRLSTITGWPSRSDIFGAIRRARMSMPPPGGNPMTMRTGRRWKSLRLRERAATSGAVDGAEHEATARRR